MAININFLNNSIDIYFQDTQKANECKNLLNDYILKNGNVDTTENENNEEINEIPENFEDIENNLNVEKDEINKKNYIIKNYTNNLSYEDKYKIDFKLNNLSNFNLDVFSNGFFNNLLELPEELITALKNEKQFLIVPDEIIIFDYIVMPILNFLKTRQALNLKLEIEYKNLEKYNKSYKLIKKDKPTTVFPIQLVKQKIFKTFVDYFSNKGIKIKGINSYSNALANYYCNHVRGAKNASIVVKISETKTTIFAIVHGFVLCVETLNCGEKEVYSNFAYKFDEYSKKSISHKFVCYSVSQILDGGNKENVTREQIEKSYPKTKINPMAGNFQSRTLNIVDLIHKKVDDMKMFLNSSAFHIDIENVFVDVKNDEVFNSLKFSNAIKVYFPESEIFNNCKNNKLFNVKTISSKLTAKGFLWRNLWSKKRKKG